MKTQYLRLNNKLIAVNGSDPLKYKDLSTGKIHHYSEFKPGEAIYVGKKGGTFIRLVTPKRNPWAAPEKAIVQLEGNKGVSQIKLTEIQSA